MKMRYLVSLVCWAVAAVAAPARAEDSKEYFVKAAFIYNFIKFTEWPAAVAPSLERRVRICVVGDNPFGKAVSVFKEASSTALALQLSEVPLEKTEGCHIAFISASEEPHLAEVLRALQGKPLLTVSDIEGFAEKGGAIGFTPQDNKVKFTVNARAVTQSGLKIDSQLLEIALKVIK